MQIADVAAMDTKTDKRRASLALSAMLILHIACGRDTTGPQGGTATSPGEPRSAKTAMLESGANVMQGKGPVGKIAMHLVGFHPAKEDPAMQMESHHYCDQVNEDFAQCVLYDGDGPDARLHGIEFIISEKSYATLPPAERVYWHPHNYEILSGMLRLPNLPDAAEMATLRGKINSYGKTWHVWKTGVHGQQSDALPVGPAHLAWSFNADGEAAPGMIEARDRRMDLDTAQARRARAELAPLGRPQGGVNAMKDRFPGATGAPRGVSDNGDMSTTAVPSVIVRERSGQRLP
jgi:hypothetical protein